MISNLSNYSYKVNKAVIGSTRSAFRIPHNYKTTLNAGDLVPVCTPIEVLPGDTFSIDLSAVCRELTPLTPVMDNSYLQIDAFFVPYRLTWDYTKQFFGENDNGVWTQTNDYQIPNDNFDITNASNEITTGSIGDYFGLPILPSNEGNVYVNYLPLRSYALIYNYYYLNEATQAPILFSKDNTVTFGVELAAGYASKPLKVNRFNDLFTSALPAPQKGPNVPFLADYLPVVPVEAGNLPDDIPSVSDVALGDKMRWGSSTGDSSITGYTTISSNNVTVGNSGTAYIPNNLYASTIGSGLRDINSFRIAAVTQQYYETLARFGSRYEETILGLWNVKVPSQVIQIPQYIGGHKERLNMSQVLSTAEGNNYTVGSTGAFSNTGIVDNSFVTFSSYEYGMILILAHIRTDNSYSQGLPKYFRKLNKFDIYNPLFANIGNVPIKNSELFFSDDSTTDDQVFGFAEAWYEYKNLPNMLTGFMRPGVTGSLGSTWTYGREFEHPPVLNDEFTLQTSEEIDRTIAVTSSISAQFKLDIFYNMKVSRIMPLYSIPGIKRI